MSDSNPPTEPNKNRKRKSDSSTPSSSSCPPQSVPISSGSSAQSAIEEESHDPSNTPSSSSRPPQPALIFYPHLKYDVTVEILKVYNRRLFDEALRMQTENAQKGKFQNSEATPSTSSHPKSISDGAPRSEPNDPPVQIVNMMKRPEVTWTMTNYDYIKNQLDPRVNPPVPMSSIVLLYSEDIRIRHYAAQHNIPDHRTGPDASSDSLVRWDELASGVEITRAMLRSPYPPRPPNCCPDPLYSDLPAPTFEEYCHHRYNMYLNQEVATENPPPVQTKPIFPFDIQGIQPIGPPEPGRPPFPGLYHDEHNPVTNEIFDKYFLYLKSYSAHFLPPPRRHSFHSFDVISYDPSNGSQYSLDGSFPQNASVGHGQDRGLGTSHSTRDSRRKRKRWNTRQGDTSSAQLDPLSVDDIIEKLKTPTESGRIVPDEIIKKVKDFMTQNGATVAEISELVGKKHNVLKDQLASGRRAKANCYENLKSINVQELYLRLFNWFEQYDDDKKRNAVVDIHEELNARWSELDKKELDEEEERKKKRRTK